MTDDSQQQQQQQRTHIALGFSQSQDETNTEDAPPAAKKVLLGFTQTQKILEEPPAAAPTPAAAGAEKEGMDNFVYLSHMTGETQYTLSTYPSQSQINFSLMLEGNDDRGRGQLEEDHREVIELSEDTPANSSILLPNPSLETVPSIQSNRPRVEKEERNSEASSVPSEGWVTSKKNLRETYPLADDTTQPDHFAIAAAAESSAPSPEEVDPPVNVSEILRKLQEKDKQLEEMESLLKKREQEIALLEKQKLSAPPPPLAQETTTAPVPSKPIQSSSSSSFSQMNRANCLSQGGVLAVDGLLQLKHAEPTNSSEPDLPAVLSSSSSKSPSGTRFQWSSIQKVPPPQATNDSAANESSSPQQPSKLIRKKVRAIAEKQQKTNTSLKKTFDFESSSPEESPKPSKSASRVSLPTAPSPPHPPPPLKVSSKVDGSEECEWNSQEDVAKITSRVRANHTSLPNSSSKEAPDPIPQSQDLHAAALEVSPYDIPPSLRYQEDLEALKWAPLWKDLSAVGWHWQRGRGLVDFAYCRPGKNYQLGIGEEGLDYFTSQDAVIEFLFSKAQVRSLPPPPKSVKGVKEPPIPPPPPQPNQVETIIPFSQTDSETSGKSRPMKRKLEESSVQPQVVARDEPAASLENFDWKNEIQTLPWPVLWRNLQAEGWTWDYGSGLVLTWYLRPGIEKLAKGIQGISAFGSEEEVRKFLLKSIEGSGGGGGGDGGGGGGGRVLSDDRGDEVSSDDESNWRNQIQTLPWPELWSNLQDEGWTWDHGSGLVARWYLRPGIDKPVKGIRGISVFGSEEEVRNHLQGLKSDSDRAKACGAEEGDSDDWELVKHRKKRKASSSDQSYHQRSRDFYSSRGKRNDFVKAKAKHSTKHIPKKHRRHLASEFEESTQQQVGPSPLVPVLSCPSTGPVPCGSG
jgi:hypothetical protein